MFAEIKNGAVVSWPYNWDTLVKNNPNTSFPVDLGFESMYAATEAAANGNQLVRVVQADEPTFNPATHVLVQADSPVLRNGSWFLDWNVVEMSDSSKLAATQQKASSVRENRNQMLKNSDWTQGKDIPDAVSSAWAVYRKVLRDVPSQAGFPWNVQWPAQPE